jgi:Putative zinc-finger
MNCERARELMSAFYDQELEPDVEAVVREHLENCPECTQHLGQFKELSKLAADLRQPEVPAGMWSAIDASLDAQRRRPGRAGAWWPRHSRAAIAAVLLLGTSVALFSYLTRQPTDEHREMAETFNQYLDTFHKQPENAEQVLLAQYDGRLVKPEQVAELTKFDPNAPDKLPQGFSRSGIYVLKMPCCTCAQSIYKNDKGHVLALFEHADQQPSWFGDRPTITAECHGKETCLVQMHDQLAATWKCGTRYLTVVGARDVEHVVELVRFLDQKNPLLKTARRGPDGC